MFTPAAIVVQEGQRTDGLVEHIKVPTIQQQTLSGHQSLASNFESTREVSVIRISRTCILAKRNKDLILYDRTAVSSTDRLILGPFTLGFRTRGSPETIQIVIPPALYPVVLRLFHRRSSDYIISYKTVPRSWNFYPVWITCSSR